MIEALGTQFNVRADRVTTVTVFEGVVRVTSAGVTPTAPQTVQRGAIRRLPAGREARVDPQGQIDDDPIKDSTAVIAWQQRRLVFFVAHRRSRTSFGNSIATIPLSRFGSTMKRQVPDATAAYSMPQTPLRSFTWSRKTPLSKSCRGSTSPSSGRNRRRRIRNSQFRPPTGERACSRDSARLGAYCELSR